MSHLRRGRSIDGYGANFLATDFIEDLSQPLQIHRLLETIAQGLVYERMIGDLHGPYPIILAQGLFRKDCAQQVFCAHTLQGHRDFFTAAVTRHRKCPRCVPAPPIREKRRRKNSLRKLPLQSGRPQHLEHVTRRKGMLLYEGNDYPVVCGCSLQLAVEIQTKSLSECHPPGAVDASSPG